MSDLVYIIRREDGQELDVFTDRALAERWAEVTGLELEEVDPISASTLEGMINVHEGDKAEDDEPLRSTMDDPEVKADILAAGRAKFSEHPRVEAFFEHGHWWLRVWPLSDDDESEIATYDVVDADPGVDGSGFDFEALG